MQQTTGHAADKGKADDDLVLEVDGLACDVPGRLLFAAVTFTLRRGDSIAIVGASGTGKSTLLATLLGLRRPASGAVRVCGTDLHGLSGDRLAAHRQAHLGMVFQDGALFDELTAAENVAIARMLAAGHQTFAVEDAADVLMSMGVPPQTLAADLSGGERQRTAVARAIATGPSVVLADEPTGSLDTVTRDAVANQLFATARDHRCALVVATHDPTVAARADRVLDLTLYAPRQTRPDSEGA